MVIYREFCLDGKTMQEKTKEIIIRTVENYWGCNDKKDSLKLNHLGTEDSIFN